MKCIPDPLWRELEKIISQKISYAGRPEFDNRTTLNGIIYILHTGAQWNMLPENYGRFTTVHGKFMKWCRLGIFQKMMVKICWAKTREASLSFLQIACSLRLFRMAGIFG